MATWPMSKEGHGKKKVMITEEMKAMMKRINQAISSGAGEMPWLQNGTIDEENKND